MTNEDTRTTIAGNTDTSLLKILALCFMFVDHLGAAGFPRIPELRIIGRIAFPLYAWCLVVGSEKTKSPVKYAARMLGMAVISQPLYMMALNHTWLDLNILFTLTLALAAIQSVRLHRWGSQFWGPALCYALLGICKFDYGWKGITFILILYLARQNRAGLCAAFLSYSLFWGSTSTAIKNIFGFALPFETLGELGTVLAAFFRLQGMVWLALPLIAIPTASYIRMPKWLGYSMYPMHLIILIVVKVLSGFPVHMLFKGF